MNLKKKIISISLLSVMILGGSGQQESGKSYVRSEESLSGGQ